MITSTEGTQHERSTTRSRTGLCLRGSLDRLNFGYALLCLAGAAAFWATASVLDGNLDLGELQGRLTNRDDPATPAAQPRARARVQ